MTSLRASIAGACVALALAAASGRAQGQPYARLDVPDSALVRTIAASRNDYENLWNALLVAELRASLARADSAKRLIALSRRVARAETTAIGSRIALDALALRARWKPALQRLRVR